MVLRTTVRDCLYLNWALPAPALPALPEPLRYELHPAADREWGFASALLFFQDRLRFRAFPLVRLSHPQLNLRYYVLDAEGHPAAFFSRVLVPLWVMPAVRVLGNLPARAARLEFPRPSLDPEAEEWTWRVGNEDGLVVRARRGAPPVGAGPQLGGWEDTVRFFRERRRGYSEGAGGGLHRIDTQQPREPVWPMKAELEDGALVNAGLGLAADVPLALHSAWLCPEMALTFETARVHAVEEPVRRSVPAAG
jgi:hypothetical protein